MGTAGSMSKGYGVSVYCTIFDPVKPAAYNERDFCVVEGIE